MFDLEKLDADLTARETYWAGDPAIDLEQSDLARWHESGDGLVMKPQQQPAKIRWRPLDECERDEVMLCQMRGGDRGGLKAMRLAVAYGLLSVEGLKLRRDASERPSLLDAASIALVQRMGERFPVEVPGTGQVSSLAWLHQLVIRATFPGDERRG